MPRLQVFDRPLCCSTGVCGPEVDPALVAFAADLRWLAVQGVHVERINPAQEPQAFAADATVREELGVHGNACLPLVIVDGKVVSRGEIPGRARLAEWTGVAPGGPIELPVTQGGCCGGGGAGNDCCR